MNRYSKLIIITIIILTLNTNVFAQSVAKVTYDVNDFKKLVILSSLLDQCQNITKIKESKNKWQNFTKEYANYLINKNKLSEEESIQIISKILYQIDKNYGDEIPEDICLNAFVMMNNLQILNKEIK